jgi:hypothetical protein
LAATKPDDGRLEILARLRRQRCEGTVHETRCDDVASRLRRSVDRRRTRSSNSVDSFPVNPSLRTSVPRSATERELHRSAGRSTGSRSSRTSPAWRCAVRKPKFTVLNTLKMSHRRCRRRRVTDLDVRWKRHVEVLESRTVRAVASLFAEGALDGTA